MAQWLRLNVGKGKVGSVRLLSDAGVAEMHRPQMVVPADPQDPEITGTSYGLGWFVDSYRGRVRVHHGGAIDGFTAMVSFVPKEGLGVVVLTNLNGTPLPEIIARAALDRLLGLPSIDWNARYLKLAEMAKKAGDKAKGKLELEQKKGTRPAHPLDEYAGEYEHAAYGTLSVARDGAAGLRASFHGIPIRLVHWHYETFRALPEDPALAERPLILRFESDTSGEVSRLLAPLEVQAPEIVFTKRPPARLSDPAFLKTLEGTYTMVDTPTFAVTFTLKGERTLTATVTGQPQYELEPYRGTEFKLKGLTGFSVRFLPDAKGAVAEALFIQPDGVYSAKRKE